MIYRIEIPGFTPTPDNRLIGCHPMTAHKRKSRDARAVAKAALYARVPKVAIPLEERKQRRKLGIGRVRGDPDPCPRRVFLNVRGPFSVWPDPTAYAKTILDALTVNGLIVDDSAEWCEFVYPPTYARGEKLTVLTLEDLADATLRAGHDAVRGGA